METFTIIADFMIVAGIVVNVLMLVLLVKKENRALPDQLLMRLLGFLLLVNLFAYGLLHDILPILVISFLFNDTVGFFSGPMCYLYIHSLFQQPVGLIRKYRWHFLPWLVHLLFFSIPTMIAILTGVVILPHIEWFEKNSDWLCYQEVYLVVYLVFTLRLLRRFEPLLKQQYAQLTQVDVSWVRHFFLGFLFVISLDLSTTFYELIWGDLDWNTGFLTMFALTTVLAYASYQGMLQSRILLPDFLLLEKEVEEVALPAIAPVSSLPEAQNLQSALDNLMSTKQLYLNEALTLSSLSQTLNTTDKKLSLLLNQHMKTTFYDYINSYRLAEIKQLLSDASQQHRPVISLAYECGFQSKTSFYRIFKKETGMSPSEFRQRQMVS